MKPYLLQTGAVLEAVNTKPNGLTSSEAENRLQEQGKNKLTEGRKKSLMLHIWEQISDPMILVLIGAAIISGISGEIADMVIILLVVTLNAILGIVQESKAEKAIEALQKLSAPHSRVRRDGAVREIPSEDLVTGDIVLLDAGDSVPADLRLIDTISLQIEEAALTGESIPIKKNHTALKESSGADIPLGDRVNMAYMGTSIAYGRGEGVVVSTGMNTEMGKIAGIITETQDEKTPLQKKLASLSKVLSIMVLSICAVIFFTMIFKAGGFESANIFDALLTGISLAVAAIPEGLVVVVTVLLSIGVTSMSKRNAIIRRMTAVETLGCTEIICSDKTGTLTQNKMTVVDHYGDEKRLAAAFGLCNDIVPGSDNTLLGDPTEIALYEYAQKVLHSSFPDNKRVAELPFDSERKMMSTIHTAEHGFIQYTKGAAERIVSRCHSMVLDGKTIPLTSQLRQAIIAQNKQMADKALRVLAAAFRKHDKIPDEVTSAALESDMVLIGLAGMIDPVRPEVATAIKECRRAGIRPIMITGDHKDTAAAIAAELGILSGIRRVIDGAELSRMSDETFESQIDSISVYARVQPEHKVRIVNTWKKTGKITAMTGDGVNDAPSLKSADIGIGMGVTGTDVTKNVADMVLADDNFATIVYAVEEGRRIYENIRKAIQYLLASNLSEVISIFVATLAGFRLFAPIHILWINLITDTFPAMALGMEKAEPDIMKQPPRDPKASIFANGLGVDIIYQGMLITLLTLVSYAIGRKTSQETGMTMAFLTLSMCEIFHSFNMRSLNKSLLALKGHNKFLLGAMLLSLLLTMLVIYLPGLNVFFQLEALSLMHSLISLVLALMVIPVVEFVKI